MSDFKWATVKKIMEDIDAGDFLLQMKKENEIEMHHDARVWLHLFHCEDEDTLIEKFLLWESKHERHYLTKHNVQMRSNIFETAIRTWEREGDRREDIEMDSDYQCTAYEYRGYLIKTIFGQGSFTTVIKNGEEIFHST